MIIVGDLYIKHAACFCVQAAISAVEAEGHVVCVCVQMRYAAGTKDVLDRFFNNKPLKKDDVIVEVSYLACLPAASYSSGLWHRVISLFGPGVACRDVCKPMGLSCVLGAKVLSCVPVLHMLTGCCFAGRQDGCTV